MAEQCTVIGAKGFIGNRLAFHLERVGHRVVRVHRDSWPLPVGSLGHVFYCAGLTADFRVRLFETVASHDCQLVSLLERYKFESVTYLSSTRVYDGASSTAEEAPLVVRPSDPSHVYNLSKLTGESLCLATTRTARIVRLSNVYGRAWASEDFLPTIVREAVQRKAITLATALSSAKDYIAIEDAISAISQIGLQGRARIYNVASGRNTSNGELVAAIEAATGCAVRTASGAPDVRFPAIDVSRLASEFGPPTRNLLGDIPALVDDYKRYLDGKL